ncbi:uncharacterized protein BDZ99DRAFT_410806, partial [Mytilinidion resinicola]
MPSNKPRLHLALYARPKHPGSYHYALFISPKGSRTHPPTTAIKHHVKNTLLNISGELTQPWRYERVDISDVYFEQRLLARIIIGKLTAPVEVVEKVIAAVPVYQVGEEYPDPGELNAGVFSCRTWVRDVLVELGTKAVVVGLTDWEGVQRAAVEYVERKKGEGRWSGEGKGEAGTVPLLDLLEGREVV